MYVVTVWFTIDPLDRQQFESLIVANASQSLKEKGCARFDVCFSEDGGCCFLYELYEDRSAFEEHLTTQHFKAFDALAKALVRTKRAEFYHLVTQSDAQQS